MRNVILRKVSIRPAVSFLLISASVLLGSAGSVLAGTSIGVSFIGRGADPDDLLSLSDVAGVLPQAYWNNVDSQDTFKGSSGPLTDSTGHPTGVTITYDASDSWVSDGGTANPDEKLMKGIIKANPEPDTAPTNNTDRMLFTISNLPPSAVYNVIVYAIENGANLCYLSSTNSAEAAISIGSTTYYVDEEGDFQMDNATPDMYAQVTSTTTGSYQCGNYVEFDNVSPAADGTITITARKNIVTPELTDGIGVAGIQITNVSGPAFPANSEPITISQDPPNRRAAVGTTVAFTASATGPFLGAQWFKNNSPVPGGTALTRALTNGTIETTLSFAPVVGAGDNGATFYVVVSNRVSSAQSKTAVLTVGSLVQVRGAREQLWYGFTRADLTNGFSVTPDLDYAVSVFKTPDEQGDNFADRLSGLFVPPVNGNYVFFVNSDDDSDLWLSTDATPAHKQLIAQEIDWAGDENWTGDDGGAAGAIPQKRSDQFSPDGGATHPFASGIALVAGTSYYIEADHHEGGGGDFVEATFKLVGEPDPQSGDPTRINAFVLAPYVMALNGAYIVVTNPPLDTLTFQNGTASFSITAGSGYIGDSSGVGPGISYQWQTAPAGSSTYTNIPGANGTSYTTPMLGLADNGRKYQVTMIAADAATNSSAGTVTVIHDTSPPRVVQLLGVNGTLRVVTVAFNERMDPTSTQNPADYVITPGSITATNATLDSSGMVVTISVAAPLTPGVTYTLTITGARDLAGNSVAPNTTASFSFQQVTYAADILFDGPLGFYRFEDAIGSSVATNSGTTGGNGTYYTGDEGTPEDGTAALSSAKGDPGPRPPAFAGFEANNHSATFDGIGEWVDTHNQYLQHLGAFTLEYWVSTNDRTNQPTRVGIVGQNDAIEYGFIDPNTIQIWTEAAVPNVDAAWSFPDNEWHHVASLADGSFLKTYYDGVLVASKASATNDYGGSTYYVHIGGGGIFDAHGNWFNGHIDEVAIFDKAIPAARVAEHYNAGKFGGVITTSGTVTPPLVSQVNISRSASQIFIYWTPSGGTLQSTAPLTNGPAIWTDVGTANPAVIPLPAANSFYRVKF
jgi:concanavalin A-like lectin/glucanase superfamily protein/Big-like domain-containing protein